MENQTKLDLPSDFSSRPPSSRAALGDSGLLGIQRKMFEKFENGLEVKRHTF